MNFALYGLYLQHRENEQCIQGWLSSSTWYNDVIDHVLSPRTLHRSVLVCHAVNLCLPSALVEASKHQQLPLAENHPVSAATRWTTGRPERTHSEELLLNITKACEMINVHTERAEIHHISKACL